jgi:hypothetical protein
MSFLFSLRISFKKLSSHAKIVFPNFLKTPTKKTLFDPAVPEEIPSHVSEDSLFSLNLPQPGCFLTLCGGIHPAHRDQKNESCPDGIQVLAMELLETTQEDR